jgi:hypothetical protein
MRCEVAALAVGALACAASGQVQNGSFETGDFNGWIAQDIAVPFFPLGVYPAGQDVGFGFFITNPTDGDFSAVAGFDGEGPGTITIAQDLTIPAGMNGLAFDWMAAWDMTFGATLPREIHLDIEPTGGGGALQSTTLVTALPDTVEFGTGGPEVVDVSAFMGSDVRISFELEIPEPFVGPGLFELDNVRLVPAPGAAALLGMGALAFARRRR